jgi:hypothetical protein
MAENAWKEAMDAAAQEAHAELERHLEDWGVRDVALWWQRWYMRAGHKRLGRVLLEAAQAPPARRPPVQ